MLTRKQKALVFVPVMFATIGALLLRDLGLIPAVPPWAQLLVVPIAVVCFVAVATQLANAVFGNYAKRGPQAKASVLLAASAAGMLISVGALAMYLGDRGSSLSSLGLGTPATVAGWLAALLSTALWLAAVLKLGGLTRGDRGFSPSRWSISLLAAIAACCEEIIFRGFIVTEVLRLGGTSPAQVLSSALLFAVGHVISVDPRSKAKGYLVALTWYAAVGSVLAFVYIVGGRSLTPVMLVHGLMNMLLEPKALRSKLESMACGTNPTPTRSG